MSLIPNSKRDNYGFTCPSGGNWYSCGYGSYFVGCCAGEACTTGCSAGNLRVASFSKDNYAQFPDLTCPQGSQFYTCTGVTPPFWGCCKNNPCKDGSCQTGNLAPAALDRNNPVAVSAYSPTGGSSSSTASSTSTSSSGTVSSASTTSLTPSSTPTQSSTHTHQNVGAIAGGAAGGVAVLAIVIGLLIWYCRHARKSRAARNAEVQDRDHVLSINTAANEKPKAFPSPNPTLPPYSSPTPEYASYAQETYYDPSTQHSYELSGAISPTSSVARRPRPQHRLSELSADPSTARRAELESPHHSLPGSPKPRPPHSPQPSHSSQLRTSTEPNWTTRPWQGGYDSPHRRPGEHDDLGIEGSPRSGAYPGT